MLAIRFAFAVASFRAVVAQTSLYVPGFDPQPISADILGIDGQGRTTWALHQGALTGTFDEGSFPGTATLVEGANDAFLTYVDPGGVFTMGEACSFSGSLAICSATYSGEPLTETETIEPIIVQAGTTAILSTSTPVPSSTSIPPQSSAQPGSSLATSAQTSENTSSAPSPTQSSNGIAILPSFVSKLSFSAVSLALVFYF